MEHAVCRKKCYEYWL